MSNPPTKANLFKAKVALVFVFFVIAAYCVGPVGYAQLIDRTKNPNAINAGIAKSLAQQIGTGRGDMMTLDSSMYIIKRDPFRSIRRGRQLFQRKFLRSQGAGPIADDLILGGNIETTLKIGAGLSD